MYTLFVYSEGGKNINHFKIKKASYFLKNPVLWSFHENELFLSDQYFSPLSTTDVLFPLTSVKILVTRIYIYIFWWFRMIQKELDAFKLLIWVIHGVYTICLYHLFFEEWRNTCLVISNTNNDMLQRVWDELDYRIDRCHVILLNLCKITEITVSTQLFGFHYIFRHN